MGVFGASARDDTQRNDNISSLQMDIDTVDTTTTTDTTNNNTNNGTNIPTHHSNITSSLLASPSLPNRRLGGSPVRRKGAQREKGQRVQNTECKREVSHHPLCPCHNLADDSFHSVTS